MLKQIITKILYVYAVLALILSGLVVRGDIVTYNLHTYSESATFFTLCIFLLVLTSEISALTAFVCKGRDHRNIGDYIMIPVIFLAANICVSLRLILPLLRVI